jgi:SAM-dependent methyltransferase
MAKEYVLDSDTDLGRDQLEYLQILLDPRTMAYLDAIGVKPGQRCLDLGSGAGSVARELAERTGPTGRVVAMDLATDNLAEHSGVDIHQHDINDGLPVDGPFDLIHARLLLMHLSRRQEILAELSGALAPGGWLVVTDFTAPPQRVVSAPSDADEQLFYRVQERAHAFLATERGVSFEWAYAAGRHLTAMGLMNVGCESFAHTVTGGGVGCRLSRNYVMQTHDLLVAKGVATEAELSRYCDLLLDPGFTAWFYTVVTTRGQRPPA